MNPRIIAVVALVALLSGCATAPDQRTAPATPSRAVSTAPPPSASPRNEVRVGLTEWAITTDTDIVRGSDVTLLVTNAGSVSHDVRVTVGDDDVATSKNLRAGQRQRMSFVAPAGETLLLWCTVPGHTEQGMRATLTVTR